MPSTPKLALPYPALTDTPDVPYWLQQLAEKIESQGVLVQTGTVALAGDATNQRSQAVAFPTAFPGAPIVLMMSLTGATTSATTWQVWPSSITASGFAANALRNNTTAMTVLWVAVYLTA